MRKSIADNSVIQKSNGPLNKQLRRNSLLTTAHQRLHQAGTKSWLASLQQIGQRHLPREKLSSFKLDILRIGMSLRRLPKVAALPAVHQMEALWMRPRKRKRYSDLTPEVYHVPANSLTPPKETSRMNISIELPSSRDLEAKGERELKRRVRIPSPYLQLSPRQSHEWSNHNAIRKRPMRRLRVSGEKQMSGQLRQKLIRFSQRIVKFCYVFLRFRTMSQRFSQTRRAAIERSFNNFDNLMNSTLRYYSSELYYPLKYYRDLLRDYMRNPNRHYNNQALNLLNALMNKLKCTGLPGELLNLFKDISLDRGFLPVGLLTRFQLKRVPLSENFGYIKSAMPEVSTLIIGNVMCCRILLHKLLMSPWNIPTQKALKDRKNKFSKGSTSYSRQQDEDSYVLKQDYPKYRAVVEDITSAFYSIFIRHFYKATPAAHTPRLKRVLNRMHFHYSKPLSTCPQEFQQAEESEYCMNVGIFPTCNKGYYKKLLKVDDVRVEEIRSGMVDWLMRINSKALSITTNN